MFLTFDFGGSSLRAGLVDSDGHVVARHALASADLESWWDDVQSCALALFASRPDCLSKIDAVAISAMTRTQILVDGAGEATGPAIGFADARSDATLAELRGRLPLDDPEVSGINAFHPLARLFWVSRQAPEQWARSAFVIDPKDYLNARLTGEIGSDPISLARLIACRPALFTAAGLDPRLVPPLRSPLSILAPIKQGLAGIFARLAGVPVVTMAHDTWASVLGLGALRPGYAYNLTGTTEVLGLCVDRPTIVSGLLTVDWGAGVTQIGGPSLAGGDTVRWLQSILPVGVGIEEAAASVDDDAPPLLFLPYLSGERVPHWDPALRGAWVGLDRRHGPPDLARAVLEGVAHLNRLVLTRAELATGQRATEVRFGGGGAANVLWCQIKADILGRTVAVTASEDHGLVGAAIAARVALGADLGQAQREMVHVAKRFEPKADRQARAERMHRLYVEADAALAPISRQLSAVHNS